MNDHYVQAEALNSVLSIEIHVGLCASCHHVSGWQIERQATTLKYTPVGDF